MKKSTIFFFLAFLGGVICANILGVVSGRELGAMNEYLMNRYRYADIQGRELFPFLFYKRVPLFALLLFFGAGIYGTLAFDGYFCYLGFSVGFLSVIAIMNAGMKGMLLMLGFYLPQWLFYAAALLLWRGRLRHYKKSGIDYSLSGSKQKQYRRLAAAAFLAGILILLGLFLESYANPFLLRNIIRMLVHRKISF